MVEIAKRVEEANSVDSTPSAPLSPVLDKQIHFWFFGKTNDAPYHPVMFYPDAKPDRILVSILESPHSVIAPDCLFESHYGQIGRKNQKVKHSFRNDLRAATVSLERFNLTVNIVRPNETPANRKGYTIGPVVDRLAKNSPSRAIKQETVEKSEAKSKIPEANLREGHVVFASIIRDIEGFHQTLILRPTDRIGDRFILSFLESANSEQSMADATEKVYAEVTSHNLTAAAQQIKYASRKLFDLGLDLKKIYGGKYGQAVFGISPLGRRI